MCIFKFKKNKYFIFIRIHLIFNIHKKLSLNVGINANIYFNMLSVEYTVITNHKLVILNSNKISIFN